MNKDILLKDKLCRHFAAQGYYVQTEVPVFHKGGVHERKRVITDIDVLALRPGPDLSWEWILADCKTFKGQSPVNRVLWLRGLMDHFSASSGIVLLQRRQLTESDHKLFAASLQISLIDEDEFDVYDKAIIYPHGSSKYPISIDSINSLRLLHNRFTRLRDFSEYIYGYVWNEENNSDLLRKIIGETQAVAQEIDPDKREHLALILDTAGIFAVGLANCVGKIFNQYLHPNTQAKLDEALRIVIWGGRANYDFISKLRQELMRAKGENPSPEGALALPSWESFLHLIRSMLESPRLSFSVPQILRRAAYNVLNGNTFLSNVDRADLPLLKYAMLTVNYFCKASRLPPQLREILESMFIKKQSDLVQRQELPRQASITGLLDQPDSKKEKEINKVMPPGDDKEKSIRTSDESPVPPSGNPTPSSENSSPSNGNPTSSSDDEKKDTASL